ncbi:hypothetical protein HBH90_241290 [Parastagonospora nodorum]|nr:hypothetical protein HBH49_205170 [Parastagonospora nodorum]KAH4355034.1 hypothetical protein HBH94_241770 [Parastagonospora nodorum]KAH4438386.1 hypothetical protein HBH90_241290 [Parastagonospora nodorum]KAH4735281.1 hypothetical protein HBH65_243190 [Parastagonospora nodorum]KAH4977044.1 hypothetical protein HBI76_230280 [Parastagonospora nodorum]
MARVSLAVVFVIIGVVNAMGVLAAVAVQEEGVAVLRAAYATTRHPVSPRMGRRRWVREDGRAISGSPKYKQLRQEVTNDFDSIAVTKACRDLRQEVTNEFSSNAVISRDISGSPKYKQLRQEVTNEFSSNAVISRDISGSPKYKQLRQEVIKEFSSNAAIIACGQVNQETFREARNTGRCKSRAISGSLKYRQM